MVQRESSFRQAEDGVQRESSVRQNDIVHVPGGLLGAARWQRMAKVGVDMIFSILLIVLLVPLILLVVVAIKMNSRGPVLYAQERIGRGGRPFLMLKFRSMVEGADEQLERVLHLNTREGPVFKMKGDPRMTKVGAVIRRCSIDEIPQLVNVLRGEMSLVGPRPPLPREFERYDSRQRQRLTVAPGLTCTWQVSGRSDLDFATAVDMDLAYIDTWTLRKDLKLLLLTVPAVLSGRGAY
jgi:lipopolysaccharide/colanic/teichoic acid biosynthesis glycosyltransferase